MIPGSRDLPIDSVLNVRDVGGIKTTSGTAIKKHRLIRGGKPDDISREDLRLLTEDIGVSAFLDLRTPYQFDRAADTEITRAGIPRINVSLSNRLPVDGSESDYVVGRMEDGVFGDHHGSYLRRLEVPARVGKAMEVIGAESNEAVFVHCTAGKDRAGIIVAMVLATVGVHRDDIAADYAESNRAMPAFVASYFGASERFRAIEPTLDPKLLASYIDSRSEVMLEVLNSIDKKYGSPRGYLLELPNGKHIVEDLELKLLG